MKYLDMIRESRAKRERNTAEDHLKDISTLLAILCDKIDDLGDKIEDLKDTAIYLAD